MNFVAYHDRTSADHQAVHGVNGAGQHPLLELTFWAE
jgi:hypothetical protein